MFFSFFEPLTLSLLGPSSAPHAVPVTGLSLDASVRLGRLVARNSTTSCVLLVASIRLQRALPAPRLCLLLRNEDSRSLVNIPQNPQTGMV
ncbi:hypothetical protein BDR04DRAFT_1103879 [Suillus decipiens]|nr:hypothetical protein BDR04DRAFT_1103879 [Suillus decipiens]